MEEQHRTELIKYLSGVIMPRRLKKIHEVLELRTRHLTVVLEDIFQPQNASAVLRSCECFGIQDVHIIENRNQFDVNPDVVMGASKWLSLYRYQEQENNTVACIRSLKQKGYAIIATTPHKRGNTPANLPLERKTALIFGTEHKGISEQARDMADGFLKIPMAGFTESFNISVSVALALYHLSDRLRASSVNWKLPESESEALLFEWLRKSVRNPDKLIKHFIKEML